MEVKYDALKGGEMDFEDSDSDTFDDEYDSERDPYSEFEHLKHSNDDCSDAKSDEPFPPSSDHSTTASRSTSTSRREEEEEDGTASNSLNSFTCDSDTDDDDDTVISALSALGTIDFSNHHILPADVDDSHPVEGHRVHSPIQTSFLHRQPSLWTASDGFYLCALQDGTASNTEQEEESASTSYPEPTQMNRAPNTSARTDCGTHSISYKTSPLNGLLDHANTMSITHELTAQLTTVIGPIATSPDATNIQSNKLII